MNKTVRKNSYETQEHKLQKEPIPPHKKSPILKEIEELNRQC